MRSGNLSGLPNESNFDQAASVEHEYEDEDFFVTILDIAEQNNLCQRVPYCAEWVNRSALYVCKRSLVERAYETRKELGLFNLFLTSSFLDCIRKWTSDVLI